MKTIIIILLTTFVIIGCAKDTDLIIKNRTNHDLFYSINDGETVVLSGQKTNSYNFKLGKQYMLNEPNKVLKIMIEGQTYQLPYGYSGTEITLKPDKNYKIFIWPTHAMFEVHNESDISIFAVKYFQNYINNIIPSGNLLEPGTRLNFGDSQWFRIPANINTTSEDKMFYYTFQLIDIHDNVYYFGGEDLKMLKDDSYTITLQNSDNDI